MPFFFITAIKMEQELVLNDSRVASDFGGVSFSKFKKTDVKTELIKCINHNKIENACYWAAELVCAGHFSDLWEIIMYMVGKHIHVGNPKLPLYIHLRFQTFKSIIDHHLYENPFFIELHLRDNAQVRFLFAEVICILCISDKKPAFETIQIKLEEFDLTSLNSKLKAPHIHYGDCIFRENDPKEIFVCLNELAYQLNHSTKNLLKSCYWIEWLIEFDSICRRKKEPMVCETRSFVTVEGKNKNDVIWIVWELLLHQVKLQKKPVLEKIMFALLHLFSIQFSSMSKKKKRYLLYFAVELITEPISVDIAILDEADKQMVANVTKKNHIIYRNIKKNENGGLGDMKKNEKKSKLEISLQKLHQVNQC